MRVALSAGKVSDPSESPHSRNLHFCSEFACSSLFSDVRATVFSGRLGNGDV